MELPQERAALTRKMAAETKPQIFIRGDPCVIDRGSAGHAIGLAGPDPGLSHDSGPRCSRRKTRVPLVDLETHPPMEDREGD